MLQGENRGYLYCLLANPIYIGKLPHKGKLHDGKHDAIISGDSGKGFKVDCATTNAGSSGLQPSIRVFWPDAWRRPTDKN